MGSPWVESQYDAMPLLLVVSAIARFRLFRPFIDSSSSFGELLRTDLTSSHFSMAIS